MTLQALAAVLLVLLGAILSVPIAIILGIATLVLEVARQLWARNGLASVSYRRTLGTDRTSWGGEIPLAIEVWNRKRLPLAWLRADDEASPGVVVRERELVDGPSGEAVLRNAWTLAPFERVVRHLHVRSDRRGVFELGPVGLSVGDLFARHVAAEQRQLVDRFIVRPRTVPAPGLERPDRWGGVDRVRTGLTEDPARFAGIRPYAPGDPLRRIHPRVSARLRAPVTKRFEPSREREILIALDVQTDNRPVWEATYDEERVESLYVVAASVARSLAAERAAFGFAAAGYSGAETRFAHIPIAAAPGQAERIFDLLARLSSHPSAGFERLLVMVQRIARPGTTILVLTARDQTPFVPRLRRIERHGCPVVILACGPNATADAARAKRAGFAARSAALDGPWRSAVNLSIAR